MNAGLGREQTEDVINVRNQHVSKYADMTAWKCIVVQIINKL